MTDWLRSAIDRIAAAFPADSWMSYSYNVRAVVVVVLVSVLCGAVGSLVVGNRMAFFSDALAHCAFAGVTLGMILALMSGEADQDSLFVTAIMVGFGIAVGIGIAFVRERTGLANDTVIGVFFAFAIGFGGMLFASMQRRTTLNPESFLFGSPLNVYERDILALFGLVLVLAFVLSRRYNQFVLASFNPSLARSRQIPLHWCNYLFIVLLALIVNLCLRAVGALLINAMLVVPAATAANFGRNLRQMFWGSILLSLVAGIGGLWITNTVTLDLGGGNTLEPAPAGTIVVLSVFMFAISTIWKIWGARAPRSGPALAVVNPAAENGVGEPGPPRLT
jgi:zinc transport system permease protein